MSIEEKYKLMKEIEDGLKTKEAADKYGIPATDCSVNDF